MRRGILAGALALTLCPLVAHSQVSYERLVAAGRDPGNWLTYSGDYRGLRYSRLRQITPANVHRLRPLWVYQVHGGGSLETTPLVVDDVMYLTEKQGEVAALDLRTGRPLWRWDPRLPREVRTIGFDRTNRGVAILGRTVFVGTLDGRLVALDAASGAKRWESVVADNRLGYAITGAPLALKDRVIVGVAGGEAGIRGFLDAYDAATGARLWRFWTVPAPGDPGHESWSGESWKTGGGSTWVTGSYDPELDLLYWGVGNPGPDWNGDSRQGDNLYTCSLVALDAATGALRWHFQFTPHDTHDWDATEIPVLIDAHLDGRPRRLVAMANRNAFYYLLDRGTGEFVLGTPYARQTWAAGLDAKGRPIGLPGTEPRTAGTLLYPSLQGATNWFSPAFSPETGLLYVAVREMSSRYFKGSADYRPGGYFTGGGEAEIGGDSAFGAIRALDARTGERRWEFRLLSPPWSGVMVTAGGVVFGGSTEGNFYALDARSGKPLWDFQTGAGISGNPISFLLGGKQQVAIAAGEAIFVFGLP